MTDWIAFTALTAAAAWIAAWIAAWTGKVLTRRSTAREMRRLRVRMVPTETSKPSALLTEDAVARWIAEIRHAQAPIMEATTGYRSLLEAGGMSPTMAETLAAQWHLNAMSRVWCQTPHLVPTTAGGES